MQTTLPTRSDLAELRIVGTTEIADALGITRHALMMRMRRQHQSIPEPDRRLDGCLIWFVTAELCDELGVEAGELS